MEKLDEDIFGLDESYKVADHVHSHQMQGLHAICRMPVEALVL